MIKKKKENLMELHVDLRKRLIILIKKKPLPLNTIAKEIGISPHAIKNFIYATRNTDFHRLVLIENWVEEQEKK